MGVLQTPMISRAPLVAIPAEKQKSEQSMMWGPPLPLGIPDEVQRESSGSRPLYYFALKEVESFPTVDSLCIKK